MEISLPLEVASVEILRMYPGDWLVFKSEEPLDEFARKNITTQLEGLLGTRQVIVIYPPYSLGVLRREVVDRLVDPKEIQVAESEVG